MAFWKRRVENGNDSHKACSSKVTHNDMFRLVVILLEIQIMRDGMLLVQSRKAYL